MFMFFPVSRPWPCFSPEWPGFAAITGGVQNVKPAWVTPLHWNPHYSQTLCRLTLTHWLGIHSLLTRQPLNPEFVLLFLVLTVRPFDSKLTWECFRSLKSTPRQDSHIQVEKPASPVKWLMGVSESTTNVLEKSWFLHIVKGHLSTRLEGGLLIREGGKAIWFHLQWKGRW